MSPGDEVSGSVEGGWFPYFARDCCLDKRGVDAMATKLDRIREVVERDWEVSCTKDLSSMGRVRAELKAILDDRCTCSQVVNREHYSGCPLRDGCAPSPVHLPGCPNFIRLNPSRDYREEIIRPGTNTTSISFEKGSVFEVTLKMRPRNDDRKCSCYDSKPLWGHLKSCPQHQEKEMMHDGVVCPIGNLYRDKVVGELAKREKKCKHGLELEDCSICPTIRLNKNLEELIAVLKENNG